MQLSIVKFGLQDDLEELQARIYLETVRLTKKELLELIFKIDLEHYELNDEYE